MRIKKIAFLSLIIFLYYYILSYYFAFQDKTITVNNMNPREVYPIGRLVGLKLYTNGVLVIGMSEIEDEQGNLCKPYEYSNIKEGDFIKSINGIQLKSVADLVEKLNQFGDNEVLIKYQRENDEINTTIKPVKTKSGEYMIGLWVRDAAAGIGTLTYYDEKNSTFSALGHGIDDVDTGKILNISNGELVTAKIISIVKGESKVPGEIRGTIDEGENLGTIEKNTNLGVYGTVTNKEYIDSAKDEKCLLVNRNKIQLGKAYVMCQLSNEKTEKYEIEIKKILKNNYSNNKSMLIKIKDEKLIEKTGGIIPGMSGAPIIQNGNLIGAITNVLLNDPTQGYAIFADMIF